VTFFETRCKMAAVKSFDFVYLLQENVIFDCRTESSSSFVKDR